MSRSETVWIVDDDRSIRWVLEKALQQEGMTTQSFDSADGVMSRLARQQRQVRQRRGLAEQAQGRPRGRVGDRAGHPDPGRLRLHP